MSKAFPIIARTADIPSQEKLQSGNLKDLTDGSITKAKPDFYDGTCPAEVNKVIRADLGAYLVPSTNTAAPCVPNFFTEVKRPNGNAAVCKRQASYDVLFRNRIEYSRLGRLLLTHSVSEREPPPQKP